MIELSFRMMLLPPLLSCFHGCILILLASTSYLFSYYLFIFLPIVYETDPVTFLLKIFQRYFPLHWDYTPNSWGLRSSVNGPCFICQSLWTTISVLFLTQNTPGTCQSPSPSSGSQAAKFYLGSFQVALLSGLGNIPLFFSSLISSFVCIWRALHFRC